MDNPEIFTALIGFLQLCSLALLGWTLSTIIELRDRVRTMEVKLDYIACEKIAVLQNEINTLSEKLAILQQQHDRRWCGGGDQHSHA